MIELPYTTMQPPEHLEGLLAHAVDAALVVDEWGKVVFATDQACQLLKYAPGDLHGQSVELLVPQRFRLAHIARRLRFTDDRRTRPMGAGLELFALCNDGSELGVDLSLSPVQHGLQMLTVVEMRVRSYSSGA